MGPVLPVRSLIRNYILLSVQRRRNGCPLTEDDDGSIKVLAAYNLLKRESLRLRTLLALAKRRKKRRWWVRPIFADRQLAGAWFSLIPVMRGFDTDAHFEFMRMTPEGFDWLLERIEHGGGRYGGGTPGLSLGDPWAQKLDVLPLWQAAIPGRDSYRKAPMPVTMDTAVCGRHFNGADIDTHDMKELPGGAIVAVKKYRPRLHRDAVPCRFDSTAAYEPIPPAVEVLEAPTVDVEVDDFVPAPTASPATTASPAPVPTTPQGVPRTPKTAVRPSALIGSDQYIILTNTNAQRTGTYTLNLGQYLFCKQLKGGGGRQRINEYNESDTDTEIFQTSMMFTPFRETQPPKRITRVVIHEIAHSIAQTSPARPVFGHRISLHRGIEPVISKSSLRRDPISAGERLAITF
ncbi:Putative surface cell antigen sca1 [Frankliniella fusca]|uniref:Surface cell antigen sca1 n=1 Tax=Frankliniella fusca TaxID=407009 RepID=A0AAE1LS92_9NEOP|nr:Putative surface cell antigen sca1 [Frankliniella fusca]